MPNVTRKRSIPARPEEVWRLVADPYNLPLWWPETARVENVDGDPGAKRSRFTQVFSTSKGKPVRADYRCVASTRPERLVWQQQLGGTPFEKFLRSAEVEFSLEPDEAGTRLSVIGRRGLRGLSRLGAPMMTRATKRTLDAALDGVAARLGGD